MVAFPANTAIAQILEQVRSWPPAERKLLAEQILESLPANHPASGSAGASPNPTGNLAEIIGLWRDVEPKPTDEELERILEESIFEKHG